MRPLASGGDPSGRRGNPSGRRRLAYALAIGLALAAVLAVALVATAGSKGGAAAPPADCLRLWNEEAGAREYARHNATFHGYDAAQVGYMPADEAEVAVTSESAGGECVVVFPRGELDPEIVAAGQVHRDGAWTPLSEVLAEDELTELQRSALNAANATPTQTGELVPR